MRNIHPGKLAKEYLKEHVSRIFNLRVRLNHVFTVNGLLVLNIQGGGSQT